jgi:hypothetical protein
MTGATGFLNPPRKERDPARDAAFALVPGATVRDQAAGASAKRVYSAFPPPAFGVRMLHVPATLSLDATPLV